MSCLNQKTHPKLPSGMCQPRHTAHWHKDLPLSTPSGYPSVGPTLTLCWPFLYQQSLERWKELPTNVVFLYLSTINFHLGEATNQKPPLQTINVFLHKGLVRFGLEFPWSFLWLVTATEPCHAVPQLQAAALGSEASNSRPLLCTTPLGEKTHKPHRQLLRRK